MSNYASLKTKIIFYLETKVYILSLTKLSKDREIYITFLGDICINNLPLFVDDKT
jgi:hypothetical protein